MAQLLFILMLSKLASAEPCQIQPVTGEVSGRAFRLEMPEGRSIYVIGHEHGADESLIPIYKALADTKSSNPVYLKNLRSALAANARTSSHRGQDLQWLERMLPTKSLDFIGVETDQEGFNVFARASKQMQRVVEWQLARRKIKNPASLREALHLFLGTVHYLNLRGSTALKGVRILPYEDQGELQKYGAQDQNFSALTQRSRIKDKSLKSGATVYQATEMIIAQYQIFSQLSEEQILETFREQIEPGYWEDFKTLILAAASLSRTIASRDAASKSKIASASGNGAVFIGLYHLIPLTEALQKICAARTNHGNGAESVISPKITR